MYSNKIRKGYGPINRDDEDQKVEKGKKEENKENKRQGKGKKGQEKEKQERAWRGHGHKYIMKFKYFEIRKEHGGEDRMV